MAELTIHPIPLFRKNARFQRALMTYLTNFGKTLTAACYVWLINGTGHRVLVDAGSTAEKLVQREKRPEQAHAIQSIEEGLAEFGLTPEMIDIVILTHLHWDHVQLAKRYENAVFLVQESELFFARDPHPIFAGFYQKSLFDSLNFQIPLSISI